MDFSKTSKTLVYPNKPNLDSWQHQKIFARSIEYIFFAIRTYAICHMHIRLRVRNKLTEITITPVLTPTSKLTIFVTYFMFVFLASTAEVILIWDVSVDLLTAYRSFKVLRSSLQCSIRDSYEWRNFFCSSKCSFVCMINKWEYFPKNNFLPSNAEANLIKVCTTSKMYQLLR